MREILDVAKHMNYIARHPSNLPTLPTFPLIHTGRYLLPELHYRVLGGEIHSLELRDERVVGGAIEGDTRVCIPPAQRKHTLALLPVSPMFRFLYIIDSWTVLLFFSCEVIVIENKIFQHPRTHAYKLTSCHSWTRVTPPGRTARSSIAPRR